LKPGYAVFCEDLLSGGALMVSEQVSWKQA